MNLKINSPILNSISAVNEKKNKLFIQPEVFEELVSDLSVISEFFGVDEKTAAVLAVLICDQLMGEANSLNRTMRTMGFNTLDFILINTQMKEFKKAGWMKTSSKARSRYQNCSNDYNIAEEVVDAVIYNDKGRLNIALPDNLTDALLEIRKMIKELIDGYNKFQRLEEILPAIERFSQFTFIDNLMTNKDLTDIEKVTLLWSCTENLFGVEEFDLNATLDVLVGDSSEVYYLLKKIKEERIALFRDGYMRFVNPDLADFSSVSLGDRILVGINSECMKMDNKIFTSRYCKLTEPVEIKEQALFFNPENQISINEIIQFTSPDSYKSLVERFTSNGLKPGLTMLFYGLPGTGKTELVKQIAKLHHRTLLQVEIAAIKNMWVGESEKNLKRVFREYQAALKYYEIPPILFFNEADGILGERKHVNTSVDQMNNAMQNILLQELEDFQGIFIATTNLIDNIDGAFDRRMLYKLNFQNPDQDTRLRILRKEFPDLPDGLLEDISRKYSLSGGQIQNIKKKFLVDSILFTEAIDCAPKMLRYIEEETQFRTRMGSPIGFKV